MKINIGNLELSIVIGIVSAANGRIGFDLLDNSISVANQNKRHVGYPGLYMSSHNSKSSRSVIHEDIRHINIDRNELRAGVARLIHNPQLNFMSANLVVRSDRDNRVVQIVIRVAVTVEIDCGIKVVVVIDVVVGYTVAVTIEVRVNIPVVFDYSRIGIERIGSVEFKCRIDWNFFSGLARIGVWWGIVRADLRCEEDGVG
ncbi:MAG: hypothetical protein ACD_51C00035G0001 [uncultured bacterium]|nr:MAG: hypothetical protein ACD_51C00035G0001 [uncultured bacterium]